jgi:hypothetical protein
MFLGSLASDSIEMGFEDSSPDRASLTPRGSPFIGSLRSRPAHLDIEDSPKHLNEQASSARWRKGAALFSWPAAGRPRLRSFLALLILFALSAAFWTSSWPNQALHLRSAASLGWRNILHMGVGVNKRLIPS